MAVLSIYLFVYPQVFQFKKRLNCTRHHLCLVSTCIELCNEIFCRKVVFINLIHGDVIQPGYPDMYKIGDE